MRFPIVDRQIFTGKNFPRLIILGGQNFSMVIERQLNADDEAKVRRICRGRGVRGGSDEAPCPYFVLERRNFCPHSTRERD